MYNREELLAKLNILMPDLVGLSEKWKKTRKVRGEKRNRGERREEKHIQGEWRGKEFCSAVFS